MAQEKEKKFYLHTNNMLTLERDKTKEHITLCDGFSIIIFWFEGSKTINPGWMYKVIDNEK
jgi:hypothetical protein